ncbi:hypothetical protein ANCDUO_19067, partial [Ancylostoma duodenale]
MHSLLETATEELDAKYLKILDKVKNAFRPTGATKAEKVERDDYDKLAISLKIDADARATPAERTKTAEELAMEEKLHLEELESLRLARMNAEKNKHGHLSVDAEGRRDGSNKKRKRDGFEVRFDSSGALVDKDKVERVTKKKVAIDSDDELTDEELEDENEEELDDLLGENEAKKDLEVPFVFEMPRSFKALVGLLEKYPSHKMEVVLERLIKCHHPGLAEGNKKLLSQLFLYLVRFFDDCSLSSPTEESVKVLGTLTKTLYWLLK